MGRKPAWAYRYWIGSVGAMVPLSRSDSLGRAKRKAHEWATVLDRRVEIREYGNDAKRQGGRVYLALPGAEVR